MFTGVQTVIFKKEHGSVGCAPIDKTSPRNGKERPLALAHPVRMPRASIPLSGKDNKKWCKTGEKNIVCARPVNRAPRPTCGAVFGKQKAPGCSVERTSESFTMPKRNRCAAQLFFINTGHAIAPKRGRRRFSVRCGPPVAAPPGQTDLRAT